LKEKVCIAQRTIGVAGRILPSPLTFIPPSGLAEQRGEIESQLRSWRDPRAALLDEPIAAVESDVPGFVALVRTARGVRLIADLGRGIETSIETVGRALALCNGRAVPVRSHSTCDSIERWLAAQRGADSIDLTAAGAARSRRAALNRVALAIARAPRHQRLRLAPLADAARTVASAPLPEGAERVLDTLLRAELPDEAWLRSIAAFGALNTRASASSKTVSEGLVALILLQPSGDFHREL
jgi:hypothetical protein